MTADLLLCWYALGIAACGIAFATVGERVPLWAFFWFIIFGPVAFVAVLVGLLVKVVPVPSNLQQYLWRRPE